MHESTDALRKDDGCKLVFGIRRTDVTTPGEGADYKSVCSGPIRGPVGDTTREVRPDSACQCVLLIWRQTPPPMGQGTG